MESQQPFMLDEAMEVNWSHLLQVWSALNSEQVD